MAFLLVSSWLPAQRKHADPSDRSTLPEQSPEEKPHNIEEPEGTWRRKREGAHPWTPCSSPSCARGPSWTSGRCRRPWWMDPATIDGSSYAHLARRPARAAPR